jgi:GPH family glycoside/pentoside/hexuronide:cation symporter
VAEIFRNRSFRVLFFSLLLFATAAGMSSTLNNHAYTFIWKLRPESIQFMSYAYLLGILLGIPLTPPLMARMEKKAVVMVGFGLVIITWVILPPLRAAGLFTPTGAAALPWLIGSAGLVGLGSGPILIAYPAMMADAADEHELLNGERREGLYFAGLGFAGKAAAGLGAMVGGFALDLLHFPHEAGRQVGAVVAEPVLRGLVLAWTPAPAVLCLIGAAIFTSYGITRVRHEGITAQLKLKRARDVMDGRST